MSTTEAVLRKAEFDPEKSQKYVYKILTGCIVPRPIGFISTISRDGVYNAAPFSFFNGVSDIPPMLCISICPNHVTGGPKDTLTNILDTKEFVWNVVSEDIVREEDACAKPYPPEVDELEVSGLTAAPSKIVKAPCILESPVNFECRLTQTVTLPGSSYVMVIGQVVYMHVREDLMSEEGRIDPKRLRAIGRMSGFTYTRSTDMFEINGNIGGFEVRGARLSG